MLLIEGKAKRELLKSKPYHYTYDSVAGGKDDYLKVIAILKDNSRKVLENCGSAEYADSTPDQRWNCTTVRQHIATLGNVKGLQVESQEYHSWEDQEYYEDISQEEFKEGLPSLGNGQEYLAYCPIEPIDWAKVRRRLEDRLRKDPQSLRTAVAALNIQLY